MNRFLSSTTLLLATSLYGQSAQAAPQYNASVTITSPAQGQGFTAYYPNLTATVPVVITSQYVEVTGATPSTFISIQWVMNDESIPLEKNQPVIANDQSNGPTPVMTDKAGVFRRYVNGGTTGIVSDNLTAYIGQYEIQGLSVIQDATGRQYITATQTNYSVNDAS